MRSTQDFERLRRQGKRFRSRDLVGVAAQGMVSESRYGVTVSRKVGNAVVRNLVKRRLRSALGRHRRRAGRALDVTVIAEPSAALATYRLLDEQVQRVLEMAYRELG